MNLRFSVCGLLVAATGLVPFDHSGFYPWTMVVLVACTPSVGVVFLGFGPFDQWTGCAWGASARASVNQAFFPYIALRLPLARVVTRVSGVPDP